MKNQKMIRSDRLAVKRTQEAISTAIKKSIDNRSKKNKSAKKE